MDIVVIMDRDAWVNPRDTKMKQLKTIAYEGAMNTVCDGMSSE